MVVSFNKVSKFLGNISSIFNLSGLLFVSLIFVACFNVKAAVYTTTGSTTNMTLNSAWDCNCNVLDNIRNGGPHTLNINHNLTGGGVLELLGPSIILNINALFEPASVTISGYQPMQFNGGTVTTTNFTITSDPALGPHLINSTLDIDNLILGQSNVIFSQPVSSITLNATFNGGGSTAVFNSTLDVTGFSDVKNATNLQFNGVTNMQNIKIEGSSVIAFNDISVVGIVEILNSSFLQGTSPSLTYGSIDFSSGGMCGATTPAQIAALPNPINLSTCSAPLPIILAYFQAKKVDNNFVFDWKTFEEVENDYFELEYSFDAKNFISFANVAGAGTSYSPIEYEYIESNLLFREDYDVVYFRLKQVDFDGTYDFSPIVPIKLNGENYVASIELYPNPAEEYLTLKLEDWKDKEGELSVNFINGIGQVYEKTILVEAIETEISLLDLPKGVYAVQIVGLLNSYKLVIQ